MKAYDRGQESKKYSRLQTTGNNIFATFVTWTIYYQRIKAKALSGTTDFYSKSDNITKKKKKDEREAAHWHFSIGKYKQKPNIGFKKYATDQLM